MLDNLWTVLGLGSGALFAAGFRTALGRRRAPPRAAMPAISPAAGEGGGSGRLPPTIEEAELQLSLLFRRMRAYLRDPYDLAGSRIAGEAQFEDCLDLAADLTIRIGDLCGATILNAAERERIRGQILEGLMLGNRAASRRNAPAAPASGRPVGGAR